jgi:hypothetical protein
MRLAECALIGMVGWDSLAEAVLAEEFQEPEHENVCEYVPVRYLIIFRSPVSVLAA